MGKGQRLESKGFRIRLIVPEHKGNLGSILIRIRLLFWGDRLSSVERTSERTSVMIGRPLWKLLH